MASVHEVGTTSAIEPVKKHVPGPTAPEFISAAISSLLRGCGIAYPAPLVFDKEFYAECVAEAVKRGCAPSGQYSLTPFIAGGVVISTTAYGHLSNRKTRILIAVYTACGIYLDDVFQRDVAAVRAFTRRFFKHERQNEAVLDCFAGVIHDLADQFGEVVSDIMVTSTLNAVTALSLEFDTQDMQIHPEAIGYPTFTRVMSGASEAFALFIFRPELPLRAFIQALQQLTIYINNTNDILSFYKEETDGESVNRVSLLAAQARQPKAAILSQLVVEAVKANQAVERILTNESGASAVADYRAFAAGFVGFHTSLPRYRLSELDVQGQLLLSASDSEQSGVARPLL